MQEFRTEVTRRDGCVVVSAAGEVDVATSGRLADTLLTVMGPDHAQVVVDLNDVTFIDCAGLAVLVAAADRTRGVRGAFRVVGTPRARRLIDLCGLNDVLLLADSLDDAVGTG